MTHRAFGIAAAIDASLVEPLAVAAEQAGYDTFWTNDTPGADGLAVLGKAARVTSTMRLGVGVIPLDRRSPEEIAAAVAAEELPLDRLILGVGAGGQHQGSLDLVRAGLRALKSMVSCPLAVGALGPRMIALTGEEADAVLLTWQTPDSARAAAADLRRQGGIEIIEYIRTALTAGEAVLRREADRYAALPMYARHFERIGLAAFDTCAFGSPEAIQATLAGFDGTLDEAVVRAIAAEQTIESYLAVLQAAAPG